MSLSSIFSLTFFFTISCNALWAGNNKAEYNQNYGTYYEDGPSITVSNVHIVDIENRKIIRNRDIVIEGQLIKEIRSHIPSQKFQTDSVIQGNGAFVIPSVCDMHHHMTPSDFDFSGNTPDRQLKILENQAKYGIQAVMNPNITLEATQYILDQKQRSNSPSVELTGPSIGPKNGWGSHQIETKVEISEIIDMLHSRGIKHVKFTYDDMSWLGGQMPVLEPEFLRYIIEYSHSKGMKAIAHVADLTKAKELLHYGVDGLVHGIVSEKVDDEFLSLLKENEAFYIPTTAVYKTSFNFQESVKEQFEYNIWKEFSREFTDSLSSNASRDMWNSWWPKATSLRPKLANIYWNTKAVYESGNNVMLGSDTGTPGVLPGLSTYYEMELMEVSGLTPFEVLECAVINPLIYLNRYPVQGKIEKGAQANMILLKNDPTATVKNIDSAWLVLYQGTVVSRQYFKE